MESGRSHKVVVVEEGRGFGGAVVCLATAIPFLEKQGFEIHVVLAYRDKRAEQSLRSVCAHVYILEHRRRPRSVDEELERLDKVSLWRKRAWLLGLTLKETAARSRWLVMLAGLLHRVRPHVVHGNNGPQYNAPALLLARFLGIPAVVSVRGGDRRTWTARAVERLCAGEAFVSQHLMRSMSSRNRRQMVVYDGLNLDHWPRQTTARTNEGPVRVGHVGMFTPWKGQDVFLRAATQVAAGNSNVEFCLIGEAITPRDEPYAEHLRAMAAASGYKGRIHFLGFRPDVPEVLRGFDVLVHSSIHAEPLGTVVLEGMAQGLAIVASNEGGPREMIRDGVDGILVPPRDPDALALAIEHLVRQPDRARQMGMAARKRFEAMFTAQRMADGLASLYHAALQE